MTKIVAVTVLVIAFLTFDVRPRCYAVDFFEHVNWAALGILVAQEKS